MKRRQGGGGGLVNRMCTGARGVTFTLHSHLTIESALSPLRHGLVALPLPQHILVYIETRTTTISE